MSLFITLGGALFVPISQALLQSGLLYSIQTLLVLLNQEVALEPVLQAYVAGLRTTFWVAAACALAAFLAAWTGLDWKSVKERPIGRVGRSWESLCIVLGL